MLEQPILPSSESESETSEEESGDDDASAPTTPTLEERPPVLVSIQSTNKLSVMESRAMGTGPS